VLPPPPPPPPHKSHITRHCLQAAMAGSALMTNPNPNAGPTVVLCSSFGVGDSALHTPWFVRWLLKYPLADKLIQEDAIRSAGVPATIVRPMGLTDSPLAERIVATSSGPVETSRIGRADVAKFMVDSLSSAANIGKVFGLSLPK
jgi:uncharacterized protein YbjT (DUF2867 family)